MKKKMDKIYAKINEEMKLKADLSLTISRIQKFKRVAKEDSIAGRL